MAGAGDPVIVPAGVRHSEGNPGSAEIQAVVELRPALRSKEFHEAVAGLAADGKTTPRGAPRNPLQLGATFWHFRHESRVTSPPIGLQNLMLPPLWAVAKAFGVRPHYTRWDSRIRAADRPPRPMPGRGDGPGDPAGAGEEPLPRRRRDEAAEPCPTAAASGRQAASSRWRSAREP